MCRPTVKSLIWATYAMIGTFLHVFEWIIRENGAFLPQTQKNENIFSKPLDKSHSF